MAREINAQELEQLERLIDQTSLSAVLDALQTICDGKAEHLQSNWQDAGAAKNWTRAGGSIYTLRARINKRGL
jgi:hypothetical protein